MWWRSTVLWQLLVAMPVLGRPEISFAWRPVDEVLAVDATPMRKALDLLLSFPSPHFRGTSNCLGFTQSTGARCPAAHAIKPMHTPVVVTISA
jgi:hypothetical protein